MTNQVAIITDSTNDLPADLREKYHIRVVPLTIVWGDKQYLDGIEITPEQFYDRLGTTPITPQHRSQHRRISPAPTKKRI